MRMDLPKIRARMRPWIRPKSNKIKLASTPAISASGDDAGNPKEAADNDSRADLMLYRRLHHSSIPEASTLKRTGSFG